MRIIKVKRDIQIPKNYTGIVEWNTGSGSKYWYLNGNLHRVDSPAIEHFDGSKEWWLNGKRHRVDGPAYEDADGTKEWWVNDNLHRVDGPAIERADGSKRWSLNGKYHRVDGPAWEWPDGSKQWFLNDEFIFTLHPKDQPFLILEETEEEVKILTQTETKWIKNLPGLKELENVHASFNKA